MMCCFVSRPGVCYVALFITSYFSIVIISSSIINIISSSNSHQHHHLHQHHQQQQQSSPSSSSSSSAITIINHHHCHCHWCSCRRSPGLAAGVLPPKWQLWVLLVVAQRQDSFSDFSNVRKGSPVVLVVGSGPS